MNGTSNEVRDEYSLYSKEVGPICSWSEFKNQWLKAKYTFEWEGLIHQGFRVIMKNDEEEEERLAFYFNISHGWNDRDLLYHKDFSEYRYSIVGDDEYVSEKSGSYFRQEVAQKAFDVLCLKFFRIEKGLKDFSKEKMARWWLKDIIIKPIFPIILTFFSVNEDSFGRIDIPNLIDRHNDNQSHNEKFVLTFLLSLADFLFEWKELSYGYHDNAETKEKIDGFNMKVRESVDIGMIWMIDVLHQLGRLDVLEKQVLNFNKACITKLKSIAMRSELSTCKHPVRNDRKVETINEARLAGSSAAWLLTRYELMKKEYDRLDNIRMIEWKAEELKKQLEQAKRKVS